MNVIYELTNLELNIILDDSIKGFLRFYNELNDSYIYVKESISNNIGFQIYENSNEIAFCNNEKQVVEYFKMILNK